MRLIAFLTIVSLVMADVAVAALDPVEKELKDKNLQAKEMYERALKQNLDEAVKKYQRELSRQKRAGNYKRALDVQNQINKIFGREQIVMSFEMEEEADSAVASAAKPTVADQTAKFKKSGEEYNKRVYKLFVESKPLSWESARMRCELMGGHLASVSNREENLFIADLCKKSAGAFVPAWIGAWRETDKSPWLWVDGNKSNFYYWSQDEPVNKDGFNRLVTNANGQRGLWATKTENPTPAIQYYVCVWDPPVGKKASKK